MKIKFSNGKELPIIMCYNNGKRYIHGETRNSREIVLAEGVIGLDELKALLTTHCVVEVIGEDGEVEVLEDFIYASTIKDNFNGEIWFTIGQKTEAEKVIDELLIAMEV